MEGFTAATAVARISEVIGRRVDAVIVNTGWPDDDAVDRYAAEHKRPLEIGRIPDDCEVSLPRGRPSCGGVWRPRVLPHPVAPAAEVPGTVGEVRDLALVRGDTGEFWQGTFARHARRRLAYAVWGVLSRRLLTDDRGQGGPGQGLAP